MTWKHKVSMCLVHAANVQSVLLLLYGIHTHPSIKGSKTFLRHLGAFSKFTSLHTSANFTTLKVIEASS